MFSNPYSGQYRSPVTSKTFKVPRYSNKSPTSKDRYISGTPKKNLEESEQSSPFSRSPSTPKAKKTPRIKQISLDGPEMYLDMPSKLVAWNEKGILAIALGCRVYLYNPETEDINDFFPDDAYSIVNAITWVGGKLAVSSCGSVDIWDTKRQKIIEKLKGHAERCCAMDSIDLKLATGGYDGYIRIYDLSSGASTKMQISDEEILALKWSQDGRYLAISCGDNCVHIIGADNYQKSFEFNSPCHGLAWMQCTLFTGDMDGVLRKISIPSGREVLEASTRSGISSLCWSSDWGLILTNTRSTSSWEIYNTDLSRNTKFTAENGATLCADFCDEKNYIAIAAANEIIVVAKLFEMTPKKPTRSPSPFKTYRNIR